MNSRLPGPTTAIAAMLLFVMTAWLGVRGPITFSDLKDWQPLMAACVALVAGALAYRGAMAKVAFDREVHERDARRERLGAYMRLRYPMQSLYQRTHAIEDATKSQIKYSNTTIVNERLRLVLPTEIDEAWSRLDLFPQNVARDLAQVRRSMADLAEFVGAHPADKKWTIESLHMGEDGKTIERINRTTKAIADATLRIENWLEVALSD